MRLLLTPPPPITFNHLNRFMDVPFCREVSVGRCHLTPGARRLQPDRGVVLSEASPQVASLADKSGHVARHQSPGQQAKPRSQHLPQAVQERSDQRGTVPADLGQPPRREAERTAEDFTRRP